MCEKWLAKHTNPKTGRTNYYILTNEPLKFRDDIVYVESSNETEVINPKRSEGLHDTIPRRCIWLYDNNKKHDTLKRVYITHPQLTCIW